VEDQRRCLKAERDFCSLNWETGRKGNEELGGEEIWGGKMGESWCLVEHREKQVDQTSPPSFEPGCRSSVMPSS